MLKVTVTGKCTSGKTTVAALIEKALRDHDIDVVNNDLDVQCGSDYPEHQVMRLQELAHRGEKVVIETVQLQKGLLP